MTTTQTAVSLARMIRAELAVIEQLPPARWPTLTPGAAAAVRWLVGPYAMHPAIHGTVRTPVTTSKATS